eukprot:s168_g48.t1
MSCLTFLRCSPTDRLVKPFFIKCGDVIDTNEPWSPNTDDLMKLTNDNLKMLLTEKARSEFKPSIKTEYVKALIDTWTDTLRERSQIEFASGHSAGEQEGDEKKDREGRHPDDRKSGDGDDNDGGDDGDSSDGGDDFSAFSNDETNITVYVDTRAMLYNNINPSFKVKTSWPVRYLKLALYGKYGIPPNVQRLTAVGGGTIFSQRSFRDNNIRDGQTLVLLSFGDGGVKRTIVKGKDESKVIRLKQRVRSDVREVEVQELDELIQTLEALRDLMNTGFSIQTLLGDADGDTLKQVSDLIPVGLSGKSSTSRLASIIHKLLPDLKTLHENGLTVCKDAYQHIYHNFMTDYAEQFHTINVSDATLNHSAFKDVVQGMIDMKTVIEKQEVKEETKKQFEQLMRTEVERIRQEEAQKASLMAKKMAEEFIKQQSGVSGTLANVNPLPMEEG